MPSRHVVSYVIALSAIESSTIYGRASFCLPSASQDHRKTITRPSHQHHRPSPSISHTWLHAFGQAASSSDYSLCRLLRSLPGREPANKQEQRSRSQQSETPANDYPSGHEEGSEFTPEYDGKEENKQEKQLSSGSSLNALILTARFACNKGAASIKVIKWNKQEEHCSR
jgi:hypothetical protein